MYVYLIYALLFILTGNIKKLSISTKLNPKMYNEIFFAQFFVTCSCTCATY